MSKTTMTGKFIPTIRDMLSIDGIKMRKIPDNNRLNKLQECLRKSRPYLGWQDRADILSALSDRDALLADNENLRRGYIPQEISVECLGMLETAGCGKPGRSNTLRGMIAEIINRAEKAEAQLAHAEPVLKAIREARACPPAGHDFWIDDEIAIRRACKKFREEDES